MSRAGDEEDEVEQLLRAAQDDVLLKLSLNSHTTRAAGHSIDPDLDRRYEALKAHRNPKSISTPAKPVAASEGRIDGPVEEEDLFARFAALKKSIPSHNSNDSQSTSKEESDGDDEDDEVEKVIKWAVDAARLDPGTTSDDETDDETDDEVVIDENKGKKKK